MDDISLDQAAIPALQEPLQQDNTSSDARDKQVRSEPLQLPLSGNAVIVLDDVIKFLQKLPDKSIDLIVTDPAYSGMNQHLKLGHGRIVGTYKERGDDGKWFSEFEDTIDNYSLFLNECFRVLRNDRHIFIMFDSYSLLTLAPIVRNYFNVKNIIVWNKINIGMGHYFRRQSELIIFASKGKRPVSRRDIPDIWHIPRIHRAPYPTQKPVELFQAMIASSKANNDKEFVVCDPFMGSGSAAVAAIRCGASFIGCDISERAIEIARDRLNKVKSDGIDPYQKDLSSLLANQKVFW